jgi:hypothetical protein
VSASCRRSPSTRSERPSLALWRTALGTSPSSANGPSIRLDPCNEASSRAGVTYRRNTFTEHAMAPPTVRTPGARSRREKLGLALGICTNRATLPRVYAPQRISSRCPKTGIGWSKPAKIQTNEPRPQVVCGPMRFFTRCGQQLWHCLGHESDLGYGGIVASALVRAQCGRRCGGTPLASSPRGVGPCNRGGKGDSRPHLRRRYRSVAVQRS